MGRSVYEWLGKILIYSYTHRLIYIIVTSLLLISNCTTSENLSVIERVALSFGLSIAIVTLSILLLNLLFGMRITGFNSVLVILFMTIVPAAVYYLNRFIKRKKENASQDEIPD